MTRAEEFPAIRTQKRCMKYHLLRVRILVIAWFVIANLFLPASAQANSAPPFRSGTFGAEPLGLESVGIAHETLNIDMRPLAKNDLVEIEAVYELDNDDAAQQLELIFVTGSRDVEDFHVWLDGTELPTERSIVNQDELPPSWQRPTHTPGIGPAESTDSYMYDVDFETELVKFIVEIPNGQSKLEVAYRAKAAQNYVNTNVVNWGFAYILAPARSWAGFGSLDVSVDIPRNWEVATSPELERTGNMLQGEFDGIPSDAIAITVRKPAWLFHLATRVLTVLAGIVGLIGILLAIGFNPLRRKWAEGHSLPNWAAAFLSGLALSITGWMALFLPGILFLGNQQAPAGYGLPLIAMLIGIGGLVAMVIYLVFGGIARMVRAKQNGADRS